MWDHIKGFAEIQVDYFCCPLFVHQRHHRIPPDWWSSICPWWSCAGCHKSPLCLTCALTYLPEGSAPWSFQAQIWETHQLVVQQVLLSLLWMWVMFPLFQLLGTSPDSHNFSNMIESCLATITAISLRSLGHMSSNLIDLYTFSLMRWSQTSSAITMGGNFLTHFPPTDSWMWDSRMWGIQE